MVSLISCKVILLKPQSSSFERLVKRSFDDPITYQSLGFLDSGLNPTTRMKLATLHCTICWTAFSQGLTNEAYD